MDVITVYRAREIVTLDPGCPTAEVLAVRDGRILHVGSLDEVTTSLGSDEFVIDDQFKESVIVPGFIEAHGHLIGDGATCHFPWVGFDDRPRADGSTAPGSKSLDEIIDRLTALAGDGDGEFTAFGYDPVFLNGYSLTRHDLDRVSTVRPVCVMNASGHILYTNSAMIAARAISSATAEPGALRDHHGELTGEFQEHAMALVLDQSHLLGGNIDAAISSGAELARRAGCTTTSDMALAATGRLIDRYRSLANDEDFPVRVIYAPAMVDLRRRMSDNELLELLANQRAASTSRFRLGPLKWTADGSIQGFTASLLWPGYCSGHDEHPLLVDSDQLVEQITPFHAAGFQVAIHTNGDAATQAALEALEKILEAQPRPDHRHRLEHCQMATSSMFKKMAKLGVGANLFSNHIYYWGDVHRTRTMGPAKARRMDAAATALREGVDFSLHSDCPVTAVGPLFTMWCAVNRVTRSGHVLGENERISASDALYAMTMGSATLMRVEDELGSLEVGKWADFTVLAHNPLRVEPMAIRDIEVVTTVVAGRATS